MIIIEDMILNTTFEVIFNEFRNQLTRSGIKLFSDVKLTNNNIMVSCPFHKEGQEKHASCGISLKDGTVHCFSCGTVRTFVEMITYCLGSTNNNIGLEWIKNNVDYDLAEVRKVDITATREIQQEQYVNEEELSTYRLTHQYLYDRKLTDEVIEKFDIGFDVNFNSVTFPVRDKKGNCRFIARRNVNKKIFNYPNEVEKGLYGIYEIDKTANYVIITESIFNCLTCIVYGYNAIALNGTGSSKQIEQIKKLNVRKIILAFDNDDGGQKGLARMLPKIKNDFIIKILTVEKGKDINDLSKEEFDNYMLSI